MATQQRARYGEWLSPISSALVAAGSRPVAQPRVYGTDIYWLEGRATEGGRMTLLRTAAAGASQEHTPAPFNVRTRVHEYGGAAYVPFEGSVVFSHFDDNRLYLQRHGNEPVPITDNPKHRYADFVVDQPRYRLIGVREDHDQSDLHPDNTICAIALDGSGRVTVLVQGADFYAAPRLSPDGTQLAWLCWDHPGMPWEATELWLAGVRGDGTLTNVRKIAGGGSESICQPEWGPDGQLYFVSDRSGWWNLYRLNGSNVASLHSQEAEFGSPHWIFGETMYCFTSDNEIACTYIENGVSHLARLNLTNGSFQNIPTEYTDIREIQAGPGCLVMIAGSPTTPLELVRLDLTNRHTDALARSIDTLPDTGYLSVPESIHYPSANGRISHAFHYPPTNKDYLGLEGEKPPLIVIGHGGPTSMATSTLKLPIQYWTSRGFAVLDVNYGGSSGFGRTYRDALKGMWGIVDVEDCVYGARYLAERGLVDEDRLIIRGGSAGGFTTLSALMFHDVFKAGASYFGVSDLQSLDDDSHKFESHYNNYLIAPAEQCQQIYQERSPVNHLDKLRKPMIFFQGLDDKVVPPSQSEVMVNALKSRGIPVAYLAFEGEGHGFRKAQNIQRTLEAELYFYAKVLGFSLPEHIGEVEIDNL